MGSETGDMMDQQSQDQSVAEMHSDQIRGDRACAGCGFNLYGQTVSREPHYGLAIARCPECGTVASLQQYPVMTHWVNRFRAIIAGIYLLFLLGVFGMCVFAVSGFGMASIELASDGLADYIGGSYRAWEQAQAVSTQDLSSVNQITGYVNGRWTVMSDAYVEQQLATDIEAYGPLLSGANKEFVVLMVPAVFVCFAFGIFWSVTLLGSSRRRALIVPAVICVIGFAILFSIKEDLGSIVQAGDVARAEYMPLISVLVLSIMFAAMAAGIWLGRHIARGVVVFALPPRNRVPLGVLWTRDGLRPPGVR